MWLLPSQSKASCIPSAETVFAKIRIVDTVFEKVCQMLHTRFYQSDTQLSVSTVKKLLLLLSKADRSLVEVRHRKWIDSPLYSSSFSSLNTNEA